VGEDAIIVWCLLGKKAGDNTQVLALADELGCAYQRKRIVARPWELLTHLTLGVTLAGIDRAQSSALAAPWPDLVISAGRRNEPVARWIQRQSGGRTRLVHIGRPWAPLPGWDLVITTPQYFLPEQDNILHNSLPLHRMPEAEVQDAGERLLPRIAHLPRPWVAVLVGGDSGRFVMTRGKGAALGALGNSLAASAGGSLLVTDSARTPAAAADALQAQLQAPRYCYRWAEGGDNPYRGLLALADAFVVTGESMSMLGEAVNTGKPLYIFDVGDGARRWWTLPHNYRYKPLSHRLAMRFGPARMRRDIGKIQQALVESRRAQWLEAGMVAAAAQMLQQRLAEPPAAKTVRGLIAREELQGAARAVRQLLAAL
jgi:mitochondrial fission protein ELM1